MCRCLGVPRSSYYYHPTRKQDDTNLVSAIKTIFDDSHGIYGARKIKAALWHSKRLRVSRRHIRRIMKTHHLVSVYTKKAYKKHHSAVNEAPIPNRIQRRFSGHAPYAVVTSDLTYVKVKNKWHYICLFVDLFNREIVGYSAGAHKTAHLVYDALRTMTIDLRRIQYVHSDRGSEFNANLLDAVWKTFGIQQSLSRKGCPYDNAVSESTFHIVKTEFIRNRSFESLQQLRQELAVYVYWYNTIRIHGSLNYQTPAAVRQSPL